MRLTTTKKRKRLRTHGYLLRKRTPTGKRVIQRRIRKGRWRVSVV